MYCRDFVWDDCASKWLYPIKPFAARLGFVAPPPLFFMILPAMVLCFLEAVKFVKRLFYRKFQLH